MSITLLPVDLKIKLLELCPQLRYVFPELRELLKYFIKPNKLKYPVINDEFDVKSISINFNDLKLNFNLKKYECINDYTHREIISNVAFHPNLPIMASCCCSQNIINLWKLDEKELLINCTASLEGDSFRGYEDKIWLIIFHQTLPIMASCSEDKTVKLWELTKDGSNAYGVYVLRDHTEKFNSVVFHPSLPILITGSNEKTIKIWKINTYNYTLNLRETLLEHDNSINVITIHKKLPIMASGDYNGIVKLWLLNTVKILNEEDDEEEELKLVCFSTLKDYDYLIKYAVFHDSEPFLAACSSYCFILWKINLKNKKVECFKNILAHNEQIMSLAFHPSLPLLFSVSIDETIKLWHYNNECNVVYIDKLRGHKRGILSITIHPYLEFIVTTSYDRYIKFWH